MGNATVKVAILDEYVRKAVRLATSVPVVKWRRELRSERAEVSRLGAIDFRASLPSPATTPDRSGAWSFPHTTEGYTF